MYDKWKPMESRNLSVNSSKPYFFNVLRSDALETELNQCNDFWIFSSAQKVLVFLFSTNLPFLGLTIVK